RRPPGARACPTDARRTGPERAARISPGDARLFPPVSAAGSALPGYRPPGRGRPPVHALERHGPALPGARSAGARHRPGPSQPAPGVQPDVPGGVSPAEPPGLTRPARLVAEPAVALLGDPRPARQRRKRPAR